MPRWSAQLCKVTDVVLSDILSFVGESFRDFILLRPVRQNAGGGLFELRIRDEFIV